MRKIKFRCWDNINNRIVDDFIGYVNKGLSVGQKVSMEDIEIDCFPIMQFTGLLDKHGKEIFEGDIVKTKIWGKERNLEIKWNEDIRNCGCCNDVFGVGFDFSDMDMDDLEVIGNVYQNPELITE